MKNFIIRLLVGAVSAMFAAYILPGIHLPSFMAALVLALVLAFLNAIVKPVLVFLTIPATVITMGLFLLVINAFIIVIADNILDNFRVDSFWNALFFSLLLSIVSSILLSVLKNDRILDSEEE